MVEIIAEFTTNHMGHLGLLRRMVDAAAASGAHWIKMQAKDVETFYSKEKLDRAYASPFGRTYRDYRTMFELNGEDFREFDHHCRLCKIPWFATAQDAGSLQFLSSFNLPRYKVASSNARNRDLFKQVAETIPTDCELVVSVGGSTLQEIDALVKECEDYRRLWLLHCVAEYPCPLERARLGNIVALRQRFGCDQVRVGYSGHEQGYQATLAAVALGAEMVERHFCLSRHSFVHHIDCSLEPDEFAQMAAAIRRGETTGLHEFKVPKEACKRLFGMSSMERQFLVEQSYGNTYLGRSSGFADGLRSREGSQ